jgi:hypothetical protein
MPSTSSASRRRLERGQFSWVSLLLLAALVGGGYMAVVWVPIYVVHYEVKQTVRDFMNRAVKNQNDAWLVTGLCQRLADLDSTEEVDERGRKTRVPSVVLEPRDVTWERDTTVTPPMLHVAFDYVRVVKYPWLERTEEKTLSVDFTQDLAIPVWGTQR